MDPFDRLNENMTDVQRLMELHREEAGPSPGRKFDVEPLNKSGVVLTLACWEAYVEDCASAGFDHLVAHSPSPSALPEGVRRLVATRVKADSDTLSPWRLAGDGWRTEMKRYREAVLRKYVGPLNTPSVANVDALFTELVGFRKLSAHWKWHRMSASALAVRLAEFVSLRGDIAHRSATTRGVLKKDVVQNAAIVLRIAGITANRVREHLFDITGGYPWGKKPEPKKPGRKRLSRASAA